METFFLEILSPERNFYSGECLSVTLPISDGLIGIMAHHSPLTAVLCDGEVSFLKPDGERIICAVASGMADVADNKVCILCQSVVSPDEIDEREERKIAEEAKLRLASKQSLKEYKLWQLTYNQAASRLKIKSQLTDMNN